MSSRVSTRGQKNFTLFRNGMISYMVGLNDAGSFLVGYWNYEIVQKNVERRLSQQMLMNDSLVLWAFLTVLVHYSSYRSKLSLWNVLEENEVKTSFDLR